jgi:hypothetical protein
MKLTTKQLKQIIKEEYQKILIESDIEEIFTLKKMDSAEGWAGMLRFVFKLHKLFKQHGQDKSNFVSRMSPKQNEIYKTLQKKYITPANNASDRAFDNLDNAMDLAISGKIDLDEFEKQKDKIYKEIQQSVVDGMKAHIYLIKTISSDKIKLVPERYETHLNYLDGVLKMIRKALKNIQKIETKYGD